jgi:sarcosine oxidase, subunit gamma
MQALNITDVSELVRYGVKGPQAANWLNKHKLVIPTKANSWVLSTSESEIKGSIVMRLGTSEFLIEDQTGGQACSKLAADSLRVAGVYKVPRVDAAYILAGSDALNLLSEICALDLSESALAEHDVIMTQVGGVSATVLRQNINNEMVYRLWCDGTYGVYMKHILLEIAAELG